MIEVVGEGCQSVSCPRNPIVEYVMCGLYVERLLDFRVWRGNKMDLNQTQEEKPKTQIFRMSACARTCRECYGVYLRFPLWSSNLYRVAGHLSAISKT